ncbi:MAG: hypothetical protein R3242_11545, partial [Akkermansiaceae bacterium]|nr:hypothetical protein [Akkermansiaceae bacterium]
IFATDIAEVRLPLAPGQLRFIDLPAHADDPPVPVTLINALGRSDADEPITWKAQIIRTEGAIDEKSRELFAIARIEDPFGLAEPKPELRIGQPVRAEIQGRRMQDVFVIPRSSLRGIDTVFLIDPKESRIRKTRIQPIWSNEEVLLVRDDLKSGDWLATSRMPYVSKGAPVEIISPSVAESADEPEAASKES